MFSRFMEVYQHVFSPLYFLLIVAFILVYLEWRGNRYNLILRFGTITVVWALAYFTYQLYWIFFSNYPQWIEDGFAISGLTIGCALTGFVWWKKRWGYILPGGIVAAVAVSIPYMALSPFWNISGHVAFTTAPVVYLTLVNRKFSLLWIIPLLMTINRPLVEAHTWLQSLGGLALGFVGIIGYLVVRNRL